MALKLLPINQITSDENGVHNRIKSAGIYQMALDAYHSDCCVLPSASSGDLYQVEKNGEIYYRDSYYNPRNKSDKDTVLSKRHKPHFRFGTAAHDLIVGGVDFNKKYEIMPGHLGSSWRGAKAQNWRWYKEVRERKVALMQSEYDALKGMRDKLLTHERARLLIQNGIPELSFFMKMGDVFIKCRPDVSMLNEHPQHPGKYYIQTDIIQDYKTIDDNSEENCWRAIRKYGYLEKMANCTFMTCRMFGLNPNDFGYALIFQSHQEPHGITIIELDVEDIWLNISKNLRGVELFQEGMSIGGRWSGYTDEIVQRRMSQWDRDAINNKIKTGEYPQINTSTLKIMER